MPVFIWGNGACSGDGTSARNFLAQIASYGFLVVSQGVPGGGGSTTIDQMREAVTWAANGAGGAFNVDRTKIMTAGYSCGGTEAYAFIDDARVSSIGIYNSGMLGNYDQAKTIRKPVIIALGGPSDIAYPNVSLSPDSNSIKPLHLYLSSAPFLFIFMQTLHRRESVTTTTSPPARPPGRET